MEQNNNDMQPLNNNQNKKLKIIAIATSIIAVLGAGFGIYEYINSRNNEQKIQDLQSQINQLTTGSSSDKNYHYSIEIVSSSWSGWSSEYEPDKKVSYCKIALGEKCTVETKQLSDFEGNKWDEEILSFEVTSIDDDSVSIHTFQVFSDQEDGIDLRSNKQDFVIKHGESIELTTPTMDMGYVFTLSLWPASVERVDAGL